MCSTSYALTNVASGVAVAGAHPLVAPVFRNLPLLVIAYLQVLRAPGSLAALDPRSERFIGWKPFGALLVTGTNQVAIGTVGLFYALRVGGVVLVVPVIATQMLWGALLARAILRERLTGRVLAGLAGAIAGIALLAYGQWLGSDGGVGSLWAVPLALLPAVGWSVGAVGTRYALERGVNRHMAVTVQISWGVLILFVGVLLAGLGPTMLGTSLESMGWLMLAGVLSGVAVVAGVYALSLTSVASYQTINGLNPVIATLIAVVFLGEYFNVLMGIGTAVTVASVIAVQVALPYQSP